jgi:hypothetical protein
MYGKSQLMEMGLAHAKALGVNKLYASTDGNFFKEESYAQLHKQTTGNNYHSIEYGEIPSSDSEASAEATSEEVPEIIAQVSKEEEHEINEAAKVAEQKANAKTAESESDKDSEKKTKEPEEEAENDADSGDSDVDSELQNASAKDLIAMIETAESEDQVNKFLGFADGRVTVKKAGEKRIKELKK